MTKLILLLLGSFWLSCGNTPQTAKTSETVSLTNEEDNSAIMDTAALIDTLDSTLIADNEITAPAVEEKEVEKASPEKEQKDTMQKTKANETETLSKIEKKPTEVTKILAKPDHSVWTMLLQKHVKDNGDVNYKAFQNDKFALDNYLKHLAENSPKKEWSKKEKLAYYINLYNAATIKLITDNYPIKSIKDLKNPWGKDWVKTGDGQLSLGDIEHKILRKMSEPRIHFAINCASFSCPKLVNKAYTADQLENQLQKATIDFINDATKNQISAEKVQLSNIFKWFKKDFTEQGSLLDYIKSYSNTTFNPNADISYLKYDWSLNEAK